MVELSSPKFPLKKSPVYTSLPDLQAQLESQKPDHTSRDLDGWRLVLITTVAPDDTILFHTIQVTYKRLLALILIIVRMQ